uniref:EF-hand domain-containing protein n=1 Tax=Anopheles farauti TaxID=69004 RepID=A0A182Q3E8_9DIPT
MTEVMKSGMTFLQNLFRLFDMDNENFLVQDKWIEHLKGRLPSATGTPLRYPNRRPIQHDSSTSSSPNAIDRLRSGDFHSGADHKTPIKAVVRVAQEHIPFPGVASAFHVPHMSGLALVYPVVPINDHGTPLPPPPSCKWQGEKNNRASQQPEAAGNPLTPHRENGPASGRAALHQNPMLMRIYECSDSIPSCTGRHGSKWHTRGFITAGKVLAAFTLSGLGRRFPVRYPSLPTGGRRSRAREAPGTIKWNKMFNQHQFVQSLVTRKTGH